MKIAVSEAKGQLAELVRRAEAGEEVILTRHGHPAARISAVRAAHDPERRILRLQKISRAAAAKFTDGPGAARSQDFLYGDDGLPV
jgi:prevent-host-death family protein